MRDSEPAASSPRVAPAESGRRDLRWPLIILVGLVIVILVNLTFIFIAVSGADDVVPSYLTEER